MQQVPLLSIPNQSLSIALDDNVWTLKLRACNGLMAIDILKNDIEILSGFRAVPGYPLIPYKYLEDGNFVFITNDDDYPYYTQFNITQYLVYVSQTELGELRAGT